MTTATTTAPKQVAVNDIGSADDFMAAVEKTLKFFNDGDLIEGIVVKIDRDEVLLDVGCVDAECVGAGGLRRRIARRQHPMVPPSMCGRAA